MNDPVTESIHQKGAMPEDKPFSETPRRVDGVSQLCMSCSMFLLKGDIGADVSIQTRAMFLMRHQTTVGRSASSVRLF